MTDEGSMVFGAKKSYLFSPGSSRIEIYGQEVALYIPNKIIYLTATNFISMAELKTKKTEDSVDAFLKKIPETQKRKDALAIVGLMEKATKAKGKMWGTAIVGFGDRHLKYESGRELDWFIMGFSPRKQNLTLYVPGAVENNTTLLKKLGKHKTGKGCLYINKLEEVDLGVLKEIIKNGLVK